MPQILFVTGFVDYVSDFVCGALLVRRASMQGRIPDRRPSAFPRSSPRLPRSAGVFKRPAANTPLEQSTHPLAESICRETAFS
jgi:hypothetical protein